MLTALHLDKEMGPSCLQSCIVMEVNFQYKTASPMAIFQNIALILTMWGYDVKILTNQVVCSSNCYFG